MAVFERRGARQHNVSQPGGFVVVQVNANQKVERLQRARQPDTVRRADHGVPGNAYQRPNLAIPRRLDLFGQGHDRHLAKYLRVAGYSRLPAVVLERSRGRRQVIHRLIRKHGPAPAVQRPQEQVDRLDQKTGERAESLQRGTHAPVDHWAFGTHQVVQNAINLRGAQAAVGDHLRLRDVCQRIVQGAQAAHGLPRWRRVALGTQPLKKRRQQPGITARANRVVAVRGPSSFCPSWVHHRQVSASLLQGPNFVAHLRHDPQAAVGDQGVRPQHQQVVRVQDVGHRNRHVVPEHQLAGELFGQLVDAGGGEQIFRAEQAGKGPHAARQADVVCRRVAEIGRDRVVAMFANALQTRVDNRPGFFPAGLAQRLAFAHQRPPQAIWIGVELRQRNAFGTQMARRKNVVVVAANASHRAAVQLQFQTAGGFADAADSVADRLCHACPPRKIREYRIGPPHRFLSAFTACIRMASWGGWNVQNDDRRRCGACGYHTGRLQPANKQRASHEHDGCACRGNRERSLRQRRSPPGAAVWRRARPHQLFL